MKFTKNQFIRWTSKDDEGTFSHVGQVISHKNGMIIFADAMGGEMGVPEDEGKFEVVRKPRTWADKALGTGVDGKPRDPKRVAKNIRKARKARKSGEPTKKELALQLYRDLAGKGHGKAVTVQRFQDVLGMSLAGATTYYYNCKRLEG